VSDIACAMRRWTTLPLRLRLTLVFAACAAATLATVGVFVQTRTASDLLETIDAGLRSRAAILLVDTRTHGPENVNVGAGLIESDEAFAQVLDASGTVVRSSHVVAGAAMVPPEVARTLDDPAFFDRRMPGIDNLARVFAVPVETASGRSVVVVGSSLQDRADQLLQLAVTLAIGTPVALTLISIAGWLLAGAALGPVERMRLEAAAISSSDPESRLTLPAADDEIGRLGATMNAMLDRIQRSVERERRFVDDASHELRTPLSILKAELDLALARPRTADELAAALRSAAAETDHLVRLAEDLLVLARAHDGHLPVRGEGIDLRGLLTTIGERHRPAAAASGVDLSVDAPSVEICVDVARLRQALDDLLDNALRHASAGGSVRLAGIVADGSIRFDVEDSGSGFSADVLSRAFEPFVRGAGETDGDGHRSGLGLAIVRVIAEAHGGSVHAENRQTGGARVSLEVRDLG
jgi:two-component system OmpR family sensor kinase